MLLKFRIENRRHWPWGLDKFRSESLFKFRCKSLSWMIIRRWLHLSKQGVTTDLLFLLCSQWQGIHRKLCVCRWIDNNILQLAAAVSRSNSNQQLPQTGGKLRSPRKHFVYPETEKRGESIQCHAVLWICNGGVVWLFLIAELLAPDKLQKRSFCQFNAMLCYGFAMEALFGCFLLQSRLWRVAETLEHNLAKKFALV